MKPREIETALNARRDRSAWDRGVTAYALDILDDIPDDVDVTEAVALDGACNWEAYSYGACALIYDEDIARRLCTPSEGRRKRWGELPPNSRETWLDVQSRALYQAWNRIRPISLQNC